MSNAKTVATGVSQRAKKAQTVFKPVLDNPFSIQWPTIAPNVQNSILGAMVDLLSCLREYHIQRHRNIKKGKRSARKKAVNRDDQQEGSDSLGKKRKGSEDESNGLPSKRRKLDSGTTKEISTSVEAKDKVEEIGVPIDQPGILEHVKFGLNETAKSLEQHISKLRQSLLKETPLTEGTVTPRMILACRWDVNPPDLFSHIPLLVASANTLATIYDAKFSTTTLSEIKLVNLPKGSENSLSEAVGIRRLSVVTLNSKTPIGPRLTGLLNKVPRLATPWLIPTTDPTVLTSVLQSTHIKHVKTTAPTDLRAVKQERGQARKAAKQRRKESRRATERPISTMDTSNVIQPDK